MKTKQLDDAAAWAAKNIRKQPKKAAWALWVQSDGKNIRKGVQKQGEKPILMLGDINEAQ